MAKQFRLGRVKKRLMQFISELGLKEFTVEDLISADCKEKPLGNLLGGLNGLGLLKKEDHVYRVTEDF